MKRVFLDTNVVIDFLGNRQPFANHAALLFHCAETRKLELYVSVISFNNIYYILRKVCSHGKAIELLKTLNELVKVVHLDQHIIDESLESSLKDFEDAIQEVSAGKVKSLDAIVSRNAKDFKSSKHIVLSPKAAAAMLEV